MIPRIFRNFARVRAPKPKPTFKNILNQQDMEDAEPDIRILKKEERPDPKSPEIDDFFIASMNLNLQVLPEKYSYYLNLKSFQRRARQVFAKYPHPQLRKMGKEYMMLYQMLHATEKPNDISNFENVRLFLKKETFC